MEKYGEIPKRFTKKWWGYFWDYYKVHTIVAVVAVVALVSTVARCSRQVDYDLSINTIAMETLSLEGENALCAALSDAVDDIDGKDGVNVYIDQIPLGTSENELEYESTLMQKFFIELSFGEAYIYLFSKDYANSYLNRDDCADSFMSVNDWGIDGIDTSDKNKFMLYMGKSFAMSMEGNELLESVGIDTADCYLMLRYPRYNEKDDEQALKRFENAVKAIRFITE